ncbi:RrF2 family transcriptional regulator [Limnoglobus roseus]|uniref:Rrf2 family transcriptional regulator n=1 Tax=Limnoglobus roseus TaxID=2598579 RepID=A0A5C1AAU3_9BACT|nr:Rrf2 family transcriptional regulator [Limnoglobus roseus]QEL16341.1 Rrf2 family transcriptional regulator [Limnoglobus roseus]
MFLSAKAEYGCLALLELAAQHGSPKPVHLSDMASQHGIPQRFLVQIMGHLKGAGLVVSTRGASGGYHLARRPDEISLADVLNTLERTDPPEERYAPTPLGNALRAVWKRITDGRERVLSETKLSDLLPQFGGGDYVI